MKRILELVRACPPRSVRKTLKKEDSDAGSLSLKLYRYLREERWTEQEIAKKLYGKGSTPTSSAYRMLKSRLTHSLVEIILEDSVAKPSYRTYDEAYEHGFRQLEVARILIAKRLYTSAREIASQTFRRVHSFEIANLNLGLTDVLSSLHLGVAYNEDLFAKYHDLYLHYSKMVYDQSLVSDHYRRIRNHIYANRLAPVEIGNRATQFAKLDGDIRERYPNVPMIQLMCAQTELTGMIYQGQYLEAIRSAELSIERLGRSKGANLTSIGVLALSRIDCTIKLQDFTLGVKQIEAAREWVPAGTINDLKIYEYAIRLGLQTGHYEYAYQALEEVHQGKLKGLLTARHQEYWRLLEAYIQMLIMAGELALNDSENRLRPFRLNKFLNNVPANVRNKRGSNIQLLILQAIILILKGDTDKVIDRTDALSIYCNRYLRDNENLRNNGFFKLLLIVIQSNFNRKMAERKATQTLITMRKAKERGLQNDLELIPYETLWSILVKHLD